MSQGLHPKVLLAEAFDFIKRADESSAMAEKMQQGWFRSSDRDVAKVKAEYKRAYTLYIEALERFSQVRNVSGGDRDMQQFCAGHMKANMDKCESVKEKEINILLPAGHPPLRKDGYIAGEVLFERRPEARMRSKEEIYFDQLLGPGVYHLNVQYLDTPSVASSMVQVQVVMEGSNRRTMKQLKHLPPFTQWSRCLGVGAEEAPSRCRIKVTSNAWLRSLAVHVTVQSLVEATAANTVVPPPPPPYGMPGSLASLPAPPTYIDPMPRGRGGSGGGNDLADFPPPPTACDPPPPRPVTEEDLQNLRVRPAEGPSWSEGFSASAPAAAGGVGVGGAPSGGGLPPPPPVSLGEDPFALDAVLRSVDGVNGAAAPVPAHSACPESMEELRRVSGAVAEWPDQQAGATAPQLADRINALPQPSDLDPPPSTGH